MATREEIADVLAGFALFADLRRRSCWGSPAVRGVVFPQGERVLRQGLTGTGFYVILEGESRSPIDGTKRGDAPRGDFFGEVSILLGEPPTADIVASTPLHCLRCRAPAVEPFLWPTRRSCTGCSRPRPGGSATPTAGGASAWPTRRRSAVPARRLPGHRRRLRARRAPALVLAPPLRRRPRGPLRGRGRRRHVPALAVLPAAALVDQAVRARRARTPASTSATTGTASWPTSPSCARSRPSPRRDLVLPVAARDAGQPRVVRRAGGHRRPLRHALGADAARGRARRHDVHPRDHRRRVPHQVLVLAVGVARAVQPVDARASSSPPTTPTPATPRSYAGRRVFIIGKQNSGFELASGLATGPRRSPCARPRRPRPASRRSRSPASGRATCSRSRTASWGSGSGCSTPRSRA